jgi:3-hydroxymyristoyl/3-hydroxydecanoyl-(acyl carrier protein) dehydratase
MVVDPIVLGKRVDAAGAAELDLIVPHDLHYFHGHFAGAPVVPGVVQIKWAIGFARELLRTGGEFGGMEALKFQQAMQPGSRATLKLDYAGEGGKLRFSFELDRMRYSSGRILLRGAR